MTMTSISTPGLLRSVPKCLNKLFQIGSLIGAIIMDLDKDLPNNYLNIYKEWDKDSLF